MSGNDEEGRQGTCWQEKQCEVNTYLFVSMLRLDQEGGYTMERASKDLGAGFT